LAIRKRIEEAFAWIKTVETTAFVKPADETRP
jgi:hypothetical protein